MRENSLWHDRKRTFLGLPWSFTKYELTEERLFIETGFFTSTQNEVRLYRVMDVQLKRTLGQKILGLGSIRVHSSDKSLGDFEIKNIKDSKKVTEILSNTVEKQRDIHRVSNREFIVDDNDAEDMADDDDFHDGH